MATNVKNMTEGNPGKLIFGFSIPLMVGNIFQQLYTTVDTAVVGKVLGVRALAAFGADDWISWMMLGIVQGFAQGFSIRMAQEFGAKDYKGLRKTIGNAAVLSIVLSVIFLILGQLIAAPVLHILNTKEEVFGDAITYLRLYYLGTPIIMVYNFFASVLRALGDSKTPLRAIAVASVTNIGLDLLFVVCFHWGIAGAAIATIIAQMISAIYCFFYIRKVELLQLHKNDFSMDWERGRNLLFLGLPMAMQNVLIAVGGMIVQSVVNGFRVTFIAGYTAVNKLYGLLEIAATSYGFSMVTYSGQNMGAKKLDRVKKGMRSALVIAVFTSLVIMAIMIVFGREIMGIFMSGTKQEVMDAVSVGFDYLKIMSVCLPILYCLHVVRSTIQGLGNTTLPMMSGVAEFLMRTGAAIALPGLLGETGIYYAEISAWIGAVIVLIPSYFVVMHRRQREGF